jgi:hypothetical protein
VKWRRATPLAAVQLTNGWFSAVVGEVEHIKSRLANRSSAGKTGLILSPFI